MIISIITLLKRSSKSWRKMKVWCKVFTTSLKAALDSPSTRNSRIHIQKHSFMKYESNWRKGWMEITWWWINYFLLLYFHIHMVSAMIYVKWLWMEIGEWKNQKQVKWICNTCDLFTLSLNSLFFCAGKPQGHIFSFLLTAPTYSQSTAMFMCKKSIHVKSTDLNFCVHWPFGLEKPACLFTWNILK